jgi:hypothetical protein
MSDTRSPLKIYEEIVSERRTAEELCEAFNCCGYAVCFNCDRGYKAAKHELFAAIRRLDPDSVFTEVDLRVVSSEPAVWEGQLFLVGGRGQTAATVSGYMEESGIVSYRYVIKTENGKKLAFGPINVKKPSEVADFDVSLTSCDGGLILTVTQL